MVDTNVALVKTVTRLADAQRALTPIYPGTAASLYPVVSGAKTKAWMALHIGTIGLSRLFLQGSVKRFAASFHEVAEAITTSETQLRQLLGRSLVCRSRIDGIVEVRPSVMWNDGRAIQLAAVGDRLDDLDKVFNELWVNYDDARSLVRGAHLVNLTPLEEAEQCLSRGAFLGTRPTSEACNLAWVENEVRSCEQHLSDIELFLALQRGELQDILPWALHHDLTLRCHTLNVPQAWLGGRLEATDAGLQALQHTDPEALLERVREVQKHLKRCEALLGDIAQVNFLLDQSSARIQAYAQHPGFTPITNEVAREQRAFQDLLSQGKIDPSQLDTALRQVTVTLARFNTACETYEALQQRLRALAELQVSPVRPRWEKMVKDVGALILEYSPDCPQIQQLNADMFTARTAYEQLQAALVQVERHLGQRDWTMAEQYLDAADRDFRIWSDTTPYPLLIQLQDLMERYHQFAKGFKGAREHAERGRYDLAVEAYDRDIQSRSVQQQGPLPTF